MHQQDLFHVLVVGWKHILVDGLIKFVAAKSAIRFSHVVHPIYTPADWPEPHVQAGIHFFRDDLRQRMPEPDLQLLSSLEQDGVPTIHNMIMGDAIVAKLPYVEVLGYATFLARRLFELYESLKPTVILGLFDGIHGSLSLAVARRMNIPWYALHFTVIPAGFACFCDRMTPAARVVVKQRDFRESHALAASALENFERGTIKAPAYIAPPPLSLLGKIAKVPRRLDAVYRTVKNARRREFVKFTEADTDYSVWAAVAQLYRAARARRAVSRVRTMNVPPSAPYVLFGLHFQPEASTDVWAPFFSNQMWVIELLARSIPPTHKLLVKIHKSDISNHSLKKYLKIQSFPGVELVAPFADTVAFIKNASLIVSIQGTMGLEGALLGKPVIMLGDSPYTLFPSVARVREITDLPRLVRAKIGEAPPARKAIIDAYVDYLAPYLPASYNDWTLAISDEAIDMYVHLFDALAEYHGVRDSSPTSMQTSLS